MHRRSISRRQLFPYKCVPKILSESKSLQTSAPPVKRRLKTPAQAGRLLVNVGPKFSLYYDRCRGPSGIGDGVQHPPESAAEGLSHHNEASRVKMIFLEFHMFSSERHPLLLQFDPGLFMLYASES